MDYVRLPGLGGIDTLQYILIIDTFFVIVELS